MHSLTITLAQVLLKVNNLIFFLLQNVLVDDPELVIEDVDFSDSHLVLILREGRKFRLCSLPLPLQSGKVFICFLSI